MILIPYKSERIKLPETLDRRVKITKEQREEIKELYATGDYSWRKLAQMYHVDKSRIGQIVNPRLGNNVREQSRKYSATHKPSKEQRNKTVREHRKYKQQLFLGGEDLIEF